MIESILLVISIAIVLLYSGLRNMRKRKMPKTKNAEWLACAGKGCGQVVNLKKNFVNILEIPSPAVRSCGNTGAYFFNIKEVEQMTTKEKKKPFAALPTFHSSQHSRISGAPSDK